MILLVGACTTVANEAIPDPATKLDETVFRCNVEPILVRQCSYNGCHGNPAGPLRVYSPGKLRANRPTNIDDAIAPLTEAEHHANFRSTVGFGVDLAVDDNPLLRKPLPAAAGGFEHVGGAIFSGNSAGTSDPQYIAIHDWLSGKGVCK